jgi:transposase
VVTSPALQTRYVWCSRVATITVARGRNTQRGALYMAAVVGARHNPVIRAFYQRLRESGKPPKLALIACAHKLLTILISMARTGEVRRTEHA